MQSKRRDGYAVEMFLVVRERIVYKNAAREEENTDDGGPNEVGGPFSTGCACLEDFPCRGRFGWWWWRWVQWLGVLVSEGCSG